MDERPDERESHPIVPQTRVPRDEPKSDPATPELGSPQDERESHPIATRTRVP